MLLQQPKTKNELIKLLQQQQIKSIEVFEDQTTLDKRMKTKLGDKTSVIVITHR